MALSIRKNARTGRWELKDGSKVVSTHRLKRYATSAMKRHGGSGGSKTAAKGKAVITVGNNTGREVAVAAKGTNAKKLFDRAEDVMAFQGSWEMSFANDPVGFRVQATPAKVAALLRKHIKDAEVVIGPLPARRAKAINQFQRDRELG